MPVAILTGKNQLEDFLADRPMRFKRALGLALLIIAVPFAVVCIAFLFVAAGGGRNGQPLTQQFAGLFPIFLLSLWVTLICIGWTIPHQIMIEIKNLPHDDAMQRSTATRLLAYGTFVGSLLTSSVLWAAPSVHSLVHEWAIVACIVVALCNGVALLGVCTIAATLSHAFLRANNLPPQGLIRAV